MFHIKNILLFVICLLSLSAIGQETRAIDGSGNNEINVTWGAAHSQLKRITTIDYKDQISSPAAQDRLNAREISNQLFEQQNSIGDVLELSDFIWVFGQFLDHDISSVQSFNPASNPEEYLPIQVPLADEYFDVGSHIPLMRSKSSDGTGVSIDNPRQHDNAITSFIDGSGVYGSDISRANWLRSMQGGKLKVSSGNNLPWNTLSGEFNSPINSDAPFMENEGLTSKLYVAGDTRANENPLLISMHTMFLREHNKVCDEIKNSGELTTDEEIYQLARKIVSGKLQSIVYNEWLPTLNINIPSYNGYSNQVDPSISNVFSGAAFRLGHTLINSDVIRMKNNGNVISTGNIRLKDAFFNPTVVELAGGIESYIVGMATQIQQDFDCKVVGDVRNFLFENGGSGGLDLAAINIQRGRERGLPDYNTVRADMGLPKINNFNELCEDPIVVVLLAEIYGTVDNIDPWVGMLAERHLKDALFGELVIKILTNQFRSLRDGDRFYFENDNALTNEWKDVIRNTTMRSLIMRNTNISLMQDNVFRAMNHMDIPNGPDLIENDLNAIIYPNPINDHFYLKIYSYNDKLVSLEIYNNLGVIVKTESHELIEGENSLLIEIPYDFETGIYNVKIAAGETFSISRFYKS